MSQKPSGGSGRGPRKSTGPQQQRGAGNGRDSRGSGAGEQRGLQQQRPRNVRSAQRHEPLRRPVVPSGDLESLGEQMERMTTRIIEQPPTNFRFRSDAICSVFQINVEGGRKAYRYDVDIINTSSPNGKSYVKGADDGQRSLHKNICYELLACAFAKEKRFGMSRNGELVYDCRAILFTSEPTDLKNPDIVIERTNLNKKNAPYTFENSRDDAVFKITITPNQERHELLLDDLTQYITKASRFHEDRSLRTFLEMATSQFAINRGNYVQIGAGKMFETKSTKQARSGNGVELREGLAKGVRIVKDDSGSPTPAIVLDVKVSPFWKEQNLGTTIKDIINTQNRGGRQQQQRVDWRAISEMLIDVRVQVSYNPTRSFGIGYFTDKPLSKLTVKFQDRDISMSQFYSQKYQIHIEHSDWPAVVPNTRLREGLDVEMFPIEQLIVMENQRVRREKMSGPLMDELLIENTLPAKARMDKIFHHARKMELFKRDNAVLQGFGINIRDDSNRIMIGVRSLPKIKFQDPKPLDPDKEKANWSKMTRGVRYYLPMQLSKWFLICDQENVTKAKTFVDTLIRFAAGKGMTIVRPTLLSFDTPNRTNPNAKMWKRFFDRNIEPVKDRLEYIMLIDRKFEDTHGLLKYFEALYKIPTQHVTLERVIDVVDQHKNQTLENIINKLNCKISGLNYFPIAEKLASEYALENGKTLVIGYDVSHPAPMSTRERQYLRAIKQKVEKHVFEDEDSDVDLDMTSFHPSVVGICSNMSSDRHIFVGDYFYQKCRKESLDCVQLSERVSWILRSLAEHRPQDSCPPYLFILRDGISEGQFDMAYQEEIKAIKKGCSNYNSGYQPKMFFVVGTKRHFKRIFEIQEGRDGQTQLLNLLPGSVAYDQKILRADVPQLFLQAHHPLRGTAKPTEYSILLDEIGVTQDELQGLLLSLCYSHQIVNSGISIPAPVYQADEIAKRGRNNFICLKKFYQDDVPYKQKNGGTKDRIKLIDFRQLNERLSYWELGRRFLTERFTA